MPTDWKDALAALNASGILPNAESDARETSQTQDDTTVKPTAQLEVLLDKKGRHGKSATIICGFECDDNTIEDIARKLKQSIGVGGSTRGGEILLQGDWRQRAAEHLRNQGYKVKIR